MINVDQMVLIIGLVINVAKWIVIIISLIIIMTKLDHVGTILSRINICGICGAVNGIGRMLRWFAALY